MNVLIDTNIVIPMEDTSRPLDPHLAALRRLCTEHNYKLLIHPAIDDDIQRDKNEERRNNMKTRLKQYPRIQSPPKLSDTELNRYGWRQTKDNDRVDNLLLHALCRGATSFLITNDELLHRKARKAGVQEQVHRVDQFLAFLKTLKPDYSPPPFGIEKKYLHEFKIEQSFFNSLRKKYKDFDQWYLNAAREERRALSVSTDGNWMLYVSINVRTSQ